MSEIVQIRISTVEDLLKQGKNRKEIAEHFGQTMAEMNRLVWSHPKLKGRKMIKQKVDGIMLLDDEDDAPVAEMPTPTPPAAAEVEEEQVKEEPGQSVEATTDSDWAL